MPHLSQLQSDLARPALSFRAPAAAYEVANFALQIHTERDEVLSAAERLFGRFSAAEPAESAWRLTAKLGDFRTRTALPPGAQIVWRGEAAPGVLMENAVGPGYRRLDLVDRGRLEIDLTARNSNLTILPEAPRSTAGILLVSLLTTGLLDAGHSLLHASTLAARLSGAWRSVLVVAPSMTGKSTTSLSLTSAGWKLMGDDIALLSPTAEGFGVWGYPRDCHVRRPTLALLPWLAELPLTEMTSRDAFNLRVADLGARGWSELPEPLRPAAILCLEPHNAVGHRLSRIGPAEALIALSQENVQPIEGRQDAIACRDFARFAELVRGTPAWRLRVGPEPHTLATWLLPQLEEE